jgi:hypothetical protein
VYQYFAADLNADLEVPQKFRTALHNAAEIDNAAEIARGNVPELPGPVVIGLDCHNDFYRESGYARALWQKPGLREHLL